MVFRNELALKTGFTPDSLPGRENEINEIASSLKPAFGGRKAKNLFLHGPPGTGKTSCTKFVFEKLAEESQKAKTVFINCWQNPTRPSVLAKIAEAIEEPIPRRGLGADEMLHRVAQGFERRENVAVIALDECDRLLHNNEDAILYELLRSEFVSSLVCVTNDSAFLQKIEERTRSSLQPASLEFARYSPLQLKKILAERAEMAFRPNACPEEVIAVVAAYASKLGGDARVAIESLWQCGKNAEARNADKIERKDFEKLKENPSVEKRLAGLSGTEEKIIGILRGRKNKTATSGELYAELGANERTALNYLHLLENKKIIEVEKVVSKKGATSRIRLLIC